MRTPTWAALWSVPLAVVFIVLHAAMSGCGDSGQSPSGGQADVGVGGVEDAAPLPSAREIPQLGPSGLESIEVITGGASATDSLPLVIALHDAGDDPESFSKIFDGFERQARVIIPRGPLKHEKGRAWLQPGPDAMVSRMMTRMADKVAALADEIAASRPTKGKATLTGISQGGMIAFVAAARQPERVGAVVPVSAWLPQFAWPDQDRFVGNRPVVRALSGANDELTKATDLRRCIVKLRMLKLDATVRLYADTGHVISPAITTDLFRTLSWFVEGNEAPRPCEPCPGDSMDPEACSMCAGGPPASTESTATNVNGSAPPRAAATGADSSRGEGAGSSGPDIALGGRAVTSMLKTGGGGQGSLSREEIQRTFRKNMAPIRFCHERQLAAQPDLAGRLSVRFVIAPDGAVSSAEIATSTLGNDSVEECVRRAVTRIRFPRPQGGGAVAVTYPFTFAAADR